MSRFEWEGRYRRRKAFNKMLARTIPVQDRLEDVARSGYSNAKSALAAHRDQGHSRIELATPPSGPKVDWHVILSDESGDKAAWRIEQNARALALAFGPGGIKKKGG